MRRCGRRLARFSDEHGRELFDLPDAPRPAAATPAPIRFLPEFDNLILAHADRARLIADEHRARVTTKNLRVNATVLYDGESAATLVVRRTAAAAALAAHAVSRACRQRRGGDRAGGATLLAALRGRARRRAVAVVAADP